MDVSVIIPTYNRREYLERTITSVYGQVTDKKLELIIIDDASTDDTSSLIEKHKSKAVVPIKYIRHRVSLGGAVARNQGAKLATGKFIAFLDSDDEWLPNHIQSKILRMIEYSSKGVFGTFFVQNHDKRILRNFKERNQEYYSMADYILQGLGDTRTSTFVFDKEAFMDVQFDNNLKKHQDWDLAIRFAEKWNIVLDSTPTVVLYNNVGNRMSNNNNHEASSIFMGKHLHSLKDTSKAKMYINLALNTLRFEGKNPFYYDYLSQAKKYINKRDCRLMLRMLFVQMPLINSVKIYDFVIGRNKK